MDFSHLLEWLAADSEAVGVTMKRSVTQAQTMCTGIPASFLWGRAGHHTQIMGWRMLEEGGGAPGSAAVTWMERLRAMLLNPFL